MTPQAAHRAQGTTLASLPPRLGRTSHLVSSFAWSSSLQLLPVGDPPQPGACTQGGCVCPSHTQGPRELARKQTHRGHSEERGLNLRLTRPRWVHPPGPSLRMFPLLPTSCAKTRPITGSAHRAQTASQVSWGEDTGERGPAWCTCPERPLTPPGPPTRSPRVSGLACLPAFHAFHAFLAQRAAAHTVPSPGSSAP